MSSSTFISGTVTLNDAAMSVFKSRPSWEWAGSLGMWIFPTEDDDTEEPVTRIKFQGTFWNLHAHIAEDLAAAGEVGRVTGEIILEDFGWQARARYKNGKCWYGHGEPDVVMQACRLVPAADGSRDWLEPVAVDPNQGELFAG